MAEHQDTRSMGVNRPATVQSLIASCSGVRRLPRQRVQARRCHLHTHLAGTGVRLGDLPQMQHLGAPEGLVDDGSAHDRPSNTSGGHSLQLVGVGPVTVRL